ncbi:STAS domain-containing protein [candidate division CSSED10-310 bacterium]|uniref:Anti-sigma factor antagonist n=1 Tax=candidate division CSSED10-310 bacterium TaxID=2855610 RepID=A0ABV6YRS4_UNCC1
MKYEKRDVGEVTVIDLSGKITIGSGDEALRDMISAVLDEGKKNLLLNLEFVKYMDSAGIGELIRCYTRVKNAGGELKLLNLTKKIKDLLTITKLISIFEDFTDESEAVKSFT